MSKYTHHPKRAKNCVFCNNWIGDAQMQFKNAIVGYEYEASAKGKCARKNRPALVHAIYAPIMNWV